MECDGGCSQSERASFRLDRVCVSSADSRFNPTLRGRERPKTGGLAADVTENLGSRRIGLLTAVILIVGGLIDFPAPTLAPILEQASI